MDDEDSLGGPYLLRKYGPDGVPPEMPVLTMTEGQPPEGQPENPFSAGQPSPFSLGVDTSLDPVGPVPPEPPVAATPAPPAPPSPAGAPPRPAPPPGMGGPAGAPQAPAPVVPPGFRGTAADQAPPPQPTTAQSISDFLSGIGLKGIRPVAPVQGLVDALYGQSPNPEANPVYRTLRNLAPIVDAALTVLNVPVTGIGDLSNLAFAPLVIGLRAAGLAEEDVQQFVEGTRVVPELAAAFGMGAPGAMGVLGKVGNLEGAGAAMGASVRRLLKDSKVKTGDQPTRVFHGTAAAFDEFATAKADPGALYGPGLYFTENPAVAGGYAQGSVPLRRGGFTSKADAQAFAEKVGGKIKEYPNGGAPPTYQGREPVWAVEWGPAPNIRPAHLDIQQPFDIDAIMPEGFELELAGAIDARFGAGTADYALDQFTGAMDEMNPTGEVVYRIFSQKSQHANGQAIGKAGMNAVLQDLGYDGITHMGGGNTGTAPHRVWIAFSPEQVVSPFEYAAEQAGLTGATSQVVRDLGRSMSETLRNEFGGVKIGPKTAPDSTKITRLFRRGMKLGGALWYQGFGDILRTIHGDEYDMAAGVIAATSPLRQAGSRTITGEFHKGSNLEIYRRVWEAYKRGGIEEVERVSGPGREIGFMQSTKDNVIRALRREQLGGDDAMKIQNFKRALEGDKDAIVLDSWMKRIFYPLEAEKSGAFSPAQYRATEDVIRGFAQRMKVDPSDVQAALWIAKKVEDEGKALGMIGSVPFKTSLKDVMEHAGMDLSAFDEAGKLEIATQLHLASVILGAAAGTYSGDTLEEKIQNGLIGAGLGAGTPALVRLLARGLRTRQAEKASLEQLTSSVMGDVTATAGVSVLPATDAEAAAYLLRSGQVVPGTQGQLLRINWADVRDPAALDALTREVMNARPAPEIRLTHDEMRQMAREQGLTTRQVQDVMAQGGALAARMFAWKDVTQAARKHLDTLQQQVMALEETHPEFPALDAAFRQQYGVTAALAGGLLRESSELGRAMNVLKALPGEVDTAALAQMAGKDITGVPTKTLAAQLGSLPEEARVPFLRKVGTATNLTLQTLNWLYINARLFTVEGSAANALTNLAMLAESPLLRLPAAAFGTAREAIVKAAGGIPRDRVYWGSSPAQMFGIIKSVPEAMIAAYDVVKSGESKFGGIAKEAPTRSHRGLIPDEPANAAIRLAATLVELPNRILLMAPDEFAKVLNYRGEVWAQAYDMVEREFHGKWFAPLTDEAARARFLEIIRDPDSAVKQIATNKTESVGDLATDAANYRTFNEQLEGRIGQMGQALSHPLVRMTVVPFFRTPVNIFKAGLERVPGLGLLVNRAWEDLNAGGARRDLLAAKWAMGAALLSHWGLSALTDEVHGGGPRNPAMAQMWRDAGYQPYSIQVGNTVIGYNRFDVFGSLIGMSAEYAALRPYMRDDEAERIAAGMVLAVSDNMLSKTFVQGASEFLKLVMARDMQNLEKNRFVRQLLGGVVPTAVAQFERNQDPTVRAVYSMLDEIKARTPGWSETLPASLNWLTGQPRMAPQGWHPDWLPGFMSMLSPFKVTQVTSDPVVKEFLALQVGIAAPPPFIYGTDPRSMAAPSPKQGVALSAEQHHQYVKLAATLQQDGKTQYEALDAAIKADWYQSLTAGPDGSRVDALHKIVQGYRAKARAELLKDPKNRELAVAFAKKIDEYGVLKAGEAARQSPQDLETLIEGLTR